jgi:hypothetical protein
MENSIQVLIYVADLFSGLSNGFFASVADAVTSLPALAGQAADFGQTAFDTAGAGGAVGLAFAGAVGRGDIASELLAVTRRWHGSIDEQYGNINNLVVTLQAHQPAWGTPPQMTQLVDNHAELTVLIPKCRSGAGSANDRTHRNTLLKTTVGMCTGPVKLWAYTQYNTIPDTFTIDDLHSLGFLLPGELSGHHSRSAANETAAEVKVTVLSADVIRAVIDQAAGDNAALVHHGWPDGVHQALIVILPADGKTEVFRTVTTRLHNEIQMPEGSHGKAFVIKAAFLKHADDKPVFGPQPTFTMPYSTEDLIQAPDRPQPKEDA